MLKQIYVFCALPDAHQDWMDDCSSHGIKCSVDVHHLNLLVRLLRDIAEYFLDEGEKKLGGNQPQAHSAMAYFTWAKLLLERANKFAKEPDFSRLTHVESRITHVEDLIKQLNGNNDDCKPFESTR